MKVTLGPKPPSPTIDESPLTEDEKLILDEGVGGQGWTFEEFEDYVQIPENRLRIGLHGLIRKAYLRKDLGLYFLTDKGREVEGIDEK